MVPIAGVILAIVMTVDLIQMIADKNNLHDCLLYTSVWFCPLGTSEDIKPYIDPVFENNIILTQTERLTMNSRPKQPKYARNKNVLVIGGSGSGKTRFFVKPSAPVRAV